MIAAFNEAKGSIRHSLSAGQHKLWAQTQAVTAAYLCKLLEPDSILNHTDEGQRSIMCPTSLPSPGPQLNCTEAREPEYVFTNQTFCM